MSISAMLPHKTKPKCKKLDIPLDEALDILDIDKSLRKSYADEKRGAIEVVRKAIVEANPIELVESFETTQCWISIYKTGKSYLDEEIYVLTSVHKNNNKILVRFGNAVQIACIKNTYKIIN